MKILSVDDNAENLYMLEALLRGHGHTVDSASNGLDAVRLLERGGYELVISDILMPRMDGFQLCRELKKDPRWRSIPFIFYTATYTDPKDAALALGLGAARFLTKPLEPEVFMQAVEEVATATLVAEAPVAPPLEEEAVYLKEYNARLIAKLEKKLLELEAANRALKEDIEERERVEAERAQLEIQLRRAQKLEAVGNLAAGIAHDFNNLLAGISGFTEVAISEVEAGHDPRPSLRGVLEASARGRELVAQILSFSREGDLPRTELQLSGAVESALQLTRPTIPPNIEIDFAADAGLPPVLAHASHLHQVVSNLVTNARQALGGSQGRITLRLSAFEVTPALARQNPELRPGRYVHLLVADNGPGMSPEVADRIFEPFFTTKGTGKGTGLGLAVVHGIMKSYDGAITVESKPGEGTTFHLYFPALVPATDAIATVSSLRGHGERVLFVEDEPVLAALGERFLRRLGYEATATTDVADALGKFRERSYDVVITDLTMPMMSGVELARQMWRTRPNTPVILTTGFTTSLDVSRALELGFRDLLMKPYQISSFGESLKRVLAASRH